ncbi:MAG: hypothetical protein ABID45_04810 [Patescibacteria group bacterium]
MTKQKIFMLVGIIFLLSIFIIPNFCLASNYNFSGTKSGVKGKVIIKNNKNNKIAEKIVYKNKIGSKILELNKNSNKYIVVIPRKKTKIRKNLKIYKFNNKSKTLKKIVQKKIGTNKSRLKIEKESGKIVLTRKSDDTTYRIFNFNAKKKKITRYISKQDIDLGLGELYPVWGTTFEAQIPSNRSSWAMAMALSNELINYRNIDLGINDVFGIAIKESKLGCDINAADITYVPAAVNDGCFQFQGPGVGTAWEEMQQIFPTDLGSQEYDDLIPGDKFETSAIMLAYYLNFARGMFEYWGWDIDSFIINANDAEVNTKIYALAYNQGLWDADLENIMVNQRSKCLAKNDLTDCILDAGGNDYASAISNYSNNLENSDTFYEQEVSWSDIEYFLDRIEILYPEVNFAILKKRSKNVFDYLAENDQINFQEDFYSVLNMILENLSEFEDSLDQISEIY